MITNYVNFRETPLWADAKALVLEVYRLTANWPVEAEPLAKEILHAARTIAKTVPNAYRKSGITGNVHLQMAAGSFGDLQSLFEIAVALGYADSAGAEKVSDLLQPIEAKFRELRQEAKKRANELMRRRTSLFGNGDFDDDDDD